MDYSKSAVNLVNPAEVKAVLEQRQSFTSHIANLKAALEAYPEWDELRKAEKRLVDHDKFVHDAIDQYGSYQGDAGIAVKQRKVSITYLADKVLEIIPQFAQAVIEQVVNKGKVEGLLKGGLITAEQADQISTKTETYAYIIK